MIRAIHKRLEEREEGFTLIELLVVVIIIGILAAIAIPVFLNQRQRAYRAASQSDLRNLAVEAETYFTDGTTYVGFAVPGTFNVSDQVALAIPTATATTYCFEARHAGLAGTADEVWRITPGNDLEAAACP